jgi:rhamnose utilization protein RhaD (predicted bifunctional aldolase and dehydrogenase)
MGNFENKGKQEDTLLELSLLELHGMYAKHEEKKKLFEEMLAFEERALELIANEIDRRSEEREAQGE